MARMWLKQNRSTTNLPMLQHDDPSRILQLGFAFGSSKVLLTAVEMDVFTRLGERRKQCMFHDVSEFSHIARIGVA